MNHSKIILMKKKKRRIEMIYYIASHTYQSVIQNSIIECNEIIAGCETSGELHFNKFVKSNLSTFNNLDCIIIDISHFLDTDIEIITALESLRIMAENMKIIIVAANRYEGDELLTQFFQMAIYDIIEQDDFLEIKNELIHSIREGNKYKDAIRFKEAKAVEKVIVKTEIKQTVNKIMFGIAGSQSRIGTTHAAITLANYLRKRGYMVALVELNNSGAFESILKIYEERKFDDSYFTMNGVDYYIAADSNMLGNVLGKTYNFILVDHGNYETCDVVTFNKSDEHLILAGAKPWEMENLETIFDKTSVETLTKYHFYFNHTAECFQHDIKASMTNISSIHFLKYAADPFTSFDFPDVNETFQKYMPLKLEATKKRSIFSKKK